MELRQLQISNWTFESASQWVHFPVVDMLRVIDRVYRETHLVRKVCKRKTCPLCGLTHKKNLRSWKEISPPSLPLQRKMTQRILLPRKCIMIVFSFQLFFVFLRNCFTDNHKDFSLVFETHNWLSFPLLQRMQSHQTRLCSLAEGDRKKALRQSHFPPLSDNARR